MNIHARIADPSLNTIVDIDQDVETLEITTTRRGPGSCAARFSMPSRRAAAALFDRAGRMNIEVSRATCFWRGRVEDVKVQGRKADVTAYGGAAYFKKWPYTAFWSKFGVEGYKEPGNYLAAGFDPSLYESDSDNRLFVGLTKNTTYPNNSRAGGWYYTIPAGSSTRLDGVQFKYEVKIPTNWTAVCASYNAVVNNPFASSVATVWSLTGNGAVQGGGIHQTFTSSDTVVFFIRNNTGATYTHTGENSDFYIKITRLRLMTSGSSNRISKTASNALAAGSSVSATVTSTTGAYAGQDVVVTGGGVSEVTTVESVTSSTQLVLSSLANSYGAGVGLIQGFSLYADAIVKGILTHCTGNSGTGLSSYQGNIQSPGVDMTNETYIDQEPKDILDYLLPKGPTDSPLWNWWVDQDGVFYFEPIGYNAQTFYVDALDPELSRSLENMINSVYGTYQTAGGERAVTETFTDDDSIALFDFTQRAVVGTGSSNLTVAGQITEATLADTANPRGQGAIDVSQVFDGAGNLVPLEQVNAARGDIIVIRNLSPTLGTIIDRVRTFRISRTVYNAVAKTLTIEPEVAPDRV